MKSISITPELKLRHLTENDAPEVFALVDRNRERLRSWMPWVDATRTQQDSLAFIQSRIKDQSRGDHQFGIIHHKRIAGLIGFVRSNPEQGSSMLGYWLDAQEVGKGLITRSTEALLKLGFTKLGLKKIIIRAQPTNIRSCAVPERLGFTKEGIAKQAERLNGVDVDLQIYGLLHSQWQKNNS